MTWFRDKHVAFWWAAASGRCTRMRLQEGRWDLPHPHPHQLENHRLPNRRKHLLRTTIHALRRISHLVRFFYTYVSVSFWSHDIDYSCHSTLSGLIFNQCEQKKKIWSNTQSLSQQKSNLPIQSFHWRKNEKIKRFFLATYISLQTAMIKTITESLHYGRGFRFLCQLFPFLLWLVWEEPILIKAIVILFCWYHE